MNDFAEPHFALNLQRARITPSHPLRAALRAWWTRLCMDDRTAYMAQASCLSDLERRMRQWDEREREATRWLV